MKVTISSSGRFHIYDLAKQLLQRGYLEQLLTGFPKWKVDKPLRPYTKSFPWLLGSQLLLGHLGLHSLADLMSPTVQITLDHWVANNLPDSDIFVGLSQTALHSLQVAKQRGIKTVCNRGSSHIVYQDQILTEEHKKHNVPFGGVPKWAIERETAEYEEADRIAVPSNFAKRTFVANGISDEKVYVLTSGVDVSEFHPLPKEDAVFRILFVGQMSIRKGLPYLLEAVSKLRIPNCELWLLGAMMSGIEPMMEKYREHFTYLGIKPRSELSWYYSQASVFVLPSVEEGLAQVQGQALACGVPVIATTNTGGDDLFTDGVEGFIVPIQNADAIRDKILYLYENPSIREAMSRAALKRVETIGGWDAFGERAVMLYQSMLAEQ